MEDDDKYSKKLHFVTRMMLKKSEALVEDTNKFKLPFLKKLKAQKRRNKSNCESSTAVVPNEDVSDEKFPQLTASQQDNNKICKTVTILSPIKRNDCTQIDQQNLSSFEINDISNNSKNYPKEQKKPKQNQLQKHQHQQLPASWQQSVMCELTDDEFYMTKLNWENEIARHILSVFATSNVNTNIEESKAIMTFVGANIDTNDTTGPRPVDSRAAPIKEHTTISTEIIDYDANAAISAKSVHFENDAAMTNAKTTVKSTSLQKHKKSGKSKDKSESPLSANHHTLPPAPTMAVMSELGLMARTMSLDTHFFTTLHDTHRVDSPSRASRSVLLLDDDNNNNNKYTGSDVTTCTRRHNLAQSPSNHNNHAAASARISAEDNINNPNSSSSCNNNNKGDDIMEESFVKTSKFRSCHVVKTAEGQSVSLRGSPKCHAIWFVSSGDVYADWTVLPGAEKLQAHITMLYEKKDYKDYLGVLETLLTDLWRDLMFKNANLQDFGTRREVFKPKLGSTQPVLQQSPKRRPKVPPRSPFATTRTASQHAVADLDNDSDANFWADLDNSGTAVPTAHNDNSNNYDSNANKSARSARGNKSPDRNVTSPQSSRRGRGGGGGAKTIVTVDDGTSASFASKRKASAAPLNESELRKLWKQLIFTANAMGVLLVERQSFDAALEILFKAESWCMRDDIFDKSAKIDLRSYVNDAIAYYFFKKGMSMTALAHCNKALAAHEQCHHHDDAAATLLNISAVQNQMGNFKDAHKAVYQFLEVAEHGEMAAETASPKQLCLVAIGYHNLAVIQMKLHVPDLAVKSAQDAYKIARLCISYSNRWMHAFHWTHQSAMEDLKFMLTTKTELDDDQLRVIKNLTEAMYDPTPAT